jgi:hypothetical protein
VFFRLPTILKKNLIILAVESNAADKRKKGLSEKFDKLFLLGIVLKMA